MTKNEIKGFLKKIKKDCPESDIEIRIGKDCIELDVGFHQLVFDFDEDNNLTNFY